MVLLWKLICKSCVTFSDRIIEQTNRWTLNLLLKSSLSGDRFGRYEVCRKLTCQIWSMKGHLVAWACRKQNNNDFPTSRKSVTLWTLIVYFCSLVCHCRCVFKFASHAVLSLLSSISSMLSDCNGHLAAFNTYLSVTMESRPLMRIAYQII